MQRTPSADQIALARARAERAIASAEAVRASERGHKRPGRKERLQRAIDELAAAGKPLASLSKMSRFHDFHPTRQTAPIQALAKRLNVERDKLRRML